MSKRNQPASDERGDMSNIIREHWVESWEHPNYPTAVRCMAEGCEWEGRFPGDISEHVADILSVAGFGLLHPFREELEACSGEIQRLRGNRLNVEASAKTLHAHTHDSLETWGALTEQERQGWRDRAKAVIKAGQEV